MLLDEHLSPDIVNAVQAAHQDIAISSIYTWEGGQYVGADDGLLLAAAYEQQCTLVTYDQKTIVPLLRTWGEAGISHAGVIFGHSRTIQPSDIGGLARALNRLWLVHGQLDWTNRIVYLSRH